MCEDEEESLRISPDSIAAPGTEADEDHSFFPVNPGEYDEKRPRFVPLSTQVAGHDGVLSDENGFVIIKPCTDTEIQFYERCLADDHPLMECLPAFMGTLELNTPETLASMAPEVAVAVPDDVKAIVLDPAYSPPNAVYERAVVLENLSFGYAKPCIMDLKLGRRLYSDDASQEKRDRLEAVRATTTSGSLGVRIAGMKVWNDARATTTNTYREYDRHWGKTPTDTTIRTLGIEGFFAARIMRHQKQLIASRFLDEIERIIAVLDDTHVRIYSPSLLFVYEGDQASLNLAIEDEGKQMIWDELGDGDGHRRRHALGGGGISEHGSESDAELPSDDASSQDSELPREFCTCRIIDFAHAQFTPGEGRDENILYGLRSARRLILDYLDYFD